MFWSSVDVAKVAGATGMTGIDAVFVIRLKLLFGQFLPFKRM
jgi:hypothetical protein